MTEVQRTVTFGSAVGLHARPAATIAKAAADSGHAVTLEAASGKKANAASVLMLLAMTGLPKPPLMILGMCCAGLAYTLTRNENRATAAAAVAGDGG